MKFLTTVEDIHKRCIEFIWTTVIIVHVRALLQNVKQHIMKRGEYTRDLKVWAYSIYHKMVYTFT
jgi:hypothetical protein